MKIVSWLLSDDSLKITLISNRTVRKLMPKDQVCDAGQGNDSVIKHLFPKPWGSGFRFL